ncbi:MAG TPA: T9SS type A sorting domain-containing protein [Chitinophagales bacterium]|nr:T9SS type A sorting domain-containing protein [Chitinophagales bacterium]
MALGYGAWGVFGYAEVQVNGDTVVDGMPCRHLLETVVYQNNQTGSTGQFSQSRFTYALNGVAYGYNAGWDTMVNFNAIPGDSWNIPVMVNDVKATVLNTGHRTVNGFLLKWLTLAYTNAVGITDTVYERIGFAGDMYPFWMQGLIMDGDYYTFCNYSDNSFADYRQPDSICKFIVTTVFQNDPSQPLRVFPNPFTDIVRIDGTITNEPFGVKIFTSKGELIFEATNANPEVPLHSIAAGLYFLIVKSGQDIYRQKIVKTSP